MKYNQGLYLRVNGNLPLFNLELQFHHLKDEESQQILSNLN